ICSYFQFVALSLLLSFDFALRAFGSGKLSLLRNVSFQISRYLKLKNKPVDAAPKKFAASLGFVFSLSSGILHLFGLHDAATIVLVMLIFCALAESILSFCLGCLMYNWLQKYHLLNSN
ncbi:MAG TPA: DUF4395 domain-containing protein, partial [Bacteroidia bacterium]|nr:DUF4395 domain-containing protein [Bacteroidia bacterium]